MIHEKERIQAMIWLSVTALLAAGIGFLAFLAAWPLEAIVARGFSARAVADAGAYFSSLRVHGVAQWWPFLELVLLDAPVDLDGAAFVERLRRPLGAGWTLEQIARLDGPLEGLPGWGGLFVVAVFGSVMSAGAALCPYELRRKSQGAARWATRKDLVRQRLFATTGIVLGAWLGWSPLRPFSRTQKAIRNWECLSVVDLAPPGTGKTVQLVANLLADWRDTKDIPAPSIVINDPKGEIYETTAAWRSQLGPVFMLNWGEMDGDSWNPLSPASIPGGEDAAKLRKKLLAALAVLYPNPAEPGSDARAVDALVAMMKAMRNFSKGWEERIAADPTFEFLGEGAIEPADPAAVRTAVLHGDLIRDLKKLVWCYDQREQMVDRMVSVLVPDTVEEHWKNTGRAAGAGFILFHMARCDRDGTEPSFGRLLDWMAGVSKSGVDSNVAATAAAQGAPGQGKQDDNDDVAKLLIAAIDECTTYGYPPRVMQELSQLKMKPDKERGSVVSTFDSSIGVFKQASVRQKTLTSSFRLVDVRGQGTHDGHTGRPLNLKGGWFRKRELPPPVTLYICVRLDSVEQFGRVTGLLLEALASTLLSQQSDEIKKARPVYIFADEFWTLPPLQSLLQIPAFGRGQWVGLYMLGQSWNQIGLKFGNKGQDMIASMKNAMSMWIVKTQNSLQDAKDLSEAIGNATYKKWTQSRESGVKINFTGGGQGLNIGGGNTSTDIVGLPLIRHDEIGSMSKLDPKKGERGRQLLLLSGKRNTPIDCTPYIWFHDPVMKARAGRNLRPIERAKWFGGAEPDAQAPSATPPSGKPPAGGAAASAAAAKIAKAFAPAPAP